MVSLSLICILETAGGNNSTDFFGNLNQLSRFIISPSHASRAAMAAAIVATRIRMCARLINMSTSGGRCVAKTFSFSGFFLNVSEENLNRNSHTTSTLNSEMIKLYNGCTKVCEHFAFLILNTLDNTNFLIKIG